jgi:hypothetical protein
MEDWVILKDYNNDGRSDIFTYAIDFPGIVVYRNTSETALTFELEVFPFLTSLQGGGEVNILTTDVDYPGIEDVDGDGDIDILTFWGLGSFVEYHQNQSMELYGIPDSLEYVEVTQCWGFFGESDESNVIYLDTCMGKEQGTRHTGSTFLLIDFDADGDQDLLLGDVDYPNLIALTNGGNPDSAYMISQDPEFPPGNKPIQLFSMPAAAYIDVNNNGIKDLILSPFDPSLVTSENVRSVWLYQNTGANNAPQFSFDRDNFLQEDMIDAGSGAYPVFEDFDGDGLDDLLIANFGDYIYSFYDPFMFLFSVYWSNISLFLNTGTEQAPEFTRQTHDLQGFGTLQFTAFYLSFWDLDADGDKDMVSGRRDGSLLFFENLAGLGNPMDFADPQENYQGIDVGEYSTPQLFDLDKDGLPDLVVGEKNGNLNYFRNQGTLQNPQFVFITDSLGNVNVTDNTISLFGYSTPHFFEDLEGKTELIVGSEQGKLFYFKEIEENLNGTFPENDSLFLIVGDEPVDVDPGIRTAAAVAELNGDGVLDMVAGNFAGGLSYYSGAGLPPVSGTMEERKSTPLKIFPNPATTHIFLRNCFLNESVTVRIFDVYGKPVMEKTFSPEVNREISIAHLPNAVYLLQCNPISSNEEGRIARFIKVR